MLVETMLPRGRRTFAARCFALLFSALALLSWSTTALAAGSVKIASTQVEEDDGRWKLKFTIDYGRTPDLSMIPMIFEFKQVVYYERTLTDEHPDEPIVRKVAVPNATPINLPMDVSFSDVSGNAHRITKFTMPLTRSADFEAGEYELTVRLARGGTLGGKTRVILRGNNKVINRKSMDFTGDAPPPKPKPTGPPGGGEGDDGGEPKAAEDMGPDLSGIPDVPAGETDPEGPPSEKPKQGGCGCELAGAPAPSHAWGAVLLAGLVLVFRRRR